MRLNIPPKTNPSGGVLHSRDCSTVNLQDHCPCPSGHDHSPQRKRSNSLPSWIVAHSTKVAAMRLDLCEAKAPAGAGALSYRERRMSIVGLGVTEQACVTGRQISAPRPQPLSDSRRSSCCWEHEKGETCDTVDFALETSLHGLKYICQPKRHIVERIFWLIAFLTGLIMAGWLISEVWMNYLSSPLIVTFEPFETTIDKIPFPAITICNMNKVQKSRAEEYIRLAQGPDNDEQAVEARKNVYYLDHVCSSSKSFSQKFNYSTRRGQVDPLILGKLRVEDGDDEQRDVARFLQMASQPCSEMLLLCAWQDTTFNCSDLFKPIETDFGKCCTFNMLPHSLLYKNINDAQYNAKEVTGWSKWDIVKNGLLVDDNVHGTHAESNPHSHHYHHPLTFPRRQKRAGKSSGLSVLLNPDLEEYFCTSSDSHGFQLVKHLPIDNPKGVDFGIAIRPNSEVFMGIRPEITIADQDIYNFKLEKRLCYYYGEFPLAYYKIYTSSNCYDECLANQTFETCGCTLHWMPRDDSRDLCGASGFQCAELVRKSALQSGIKSRCDFCLPACTELEYFSETTFTPMQSAKDVWVSEFLRKDGSFENKTMAHWAHKNVSIVHIYFASDSFYAKLRKELYGITDLIANTGGLMGLCLGFSGLSLVELIYFYTLRAWCRKTSRRRRSLWLMAKMKFHRMCKSNKSRRKRDKISRQDSLLVNRGDEETLVFGKNQRHITLAMDHLVDYEDQKFHYVSKNLEGRGCACAKSAFYYTATAKQVFPSCPHSCCKEVQQRRNCQNCQHCTKVRDEEKEENCFHNFAY